MYQHVSSLFADLILARDLVLHTKSKKWYIIPAILNGCILSKLLFWAHANLNIILNTKNKNYKDAARKKNKQQSQSV